MINITELAQKKLGIFGFGHEGQAVAKYLQRHGLSATVFDEQPRTHFSSDLLETFESKGFVFSCGKPIEAWQGVEVVFRSPGIWRLHPALLRLEAEGIIITSQTKWFFEHCPAKIIGVTGTKGKGTTSTLIYNILTQAKVGKVVLTGNIGKVAPLEYLDELTQDDWVVMELSSFQLQDLDKSPHIGVCLMVTQEHLDHHRTIQEYRAAKEAICKHQSATDFIIFAGDYEGSREIAQKSLGQKLAFGRKEGQLAARIEENIITISSLEQGEFDFADRKLLGPHNLENISAALLATLAAGVGLQDSVPVAKLFKGLEHRLEVVGTFSGVTFVNDSFSTAPEPTIAAIKSFSNPIILICGGSEKNVNFDELATEISAAKNIKEIVLIGTTALRIQTALKQAGFAGKAKMDLSSFDEVFQYLQGISQAGDVVLLSPACASFDMFKNYIDRGEQFKEHATKFILS